MDPTQRLLGVAAILGAVATDKTDIDLETWAQDAFTDEPFKKLAAMVGIGAAIFYRAERGNNPKVNTYLDALVYVSTCCSVGYGDIFAKTELGKAVGSLVMTVGPAMANAAFNGRARDNLKEKAGDAAVQEEILVTMKEILAELRARPA